MNLMALKDLPEDGGGPKSSDVEAQIEAVAVAGYEGVQFIEPASGAQIAACERLRMGRAGLGRVNTAEEVLPLASRLAGEGMECATLHVGCGIESDRECRGLIEAVLRASEDLKLPLYVETHRATIFQDMWRTVEFVTHYPEIRFNGDFSHWYTGLEMVYGWFEKKLEFIRPVLERVRFLHGRIGDPGCIQVDVDDETQPHVQHFVALWSEAFRGFLDSAGSGDYILFVPELLSARIYYGRRESDRWAQSLVLKRLAEAAFQNVLGRTQI
jgi:hypothetical protein